MQAGRARALLLATLACCGTLGLGAAWFLRSDAHASGEGRSHAGNRLATESQSDSVAAAPTREATSEKREGVAEDAAVAADDRDAEFRGSGSITLTVVDASNDAPLADLPFLCWSERPNAHVYTRSLTDVNGQAEIENLPEDIVIFETARRPPHANTTFAIWLPNGRHKDVTMRVGHGGKVVGRVVDDLGAPLPDVEIRFDSRPAQEHMAGIPSIVPLTAAISERFQRSHDLMTKSASDGRFEADAVLSRYSSIWITHGAPDPRVELPIRIELKWRQSVSARDFKVHDGASTDVGDVTFPRARIFAGRVLDADGTPVTGALLTALWSRRNALRQRTFEPPDANWRAELRRRSEEGEEFDPSSWPGERDFKLADEETLTGSDGGYELETTSPYAGATVATSDGRYETFNWPDAAPGTRTGGLELRLKRQTLVALTLTQEGGRTLDPTARVGWATVIAATEDGTELGAETQSGGAGHFQARWRDLPIERITSLVVEVRGYARWRARWMPPPSGRDKIAVDLTPIGQRTLKLRFKLHGPEDAVALKKSQIRVEACLLGPERALARKERARCGLDAEGWIRPRATNELDLSVANDRAWNVYVQGPFVANSVEMEWIHAGAFVPGDERHGIELPPVSPKWIEEQERLAEKQKRDDEERQKSQVDPRQPPFATASVAAVDARSGAAIENPHISVRTSDDPNSWSGFGPGGPGGERGSYVLSGHHHAKVGASGYRDSAELEYTVAPSQNVDLGTVALEPMPRYALQLTERDGTPAVGRYEVSAYYPETKRRGFWYGADASGVPLDGGRFELRADLPEHFQLAVRRAGDARMCGLQVPWSQIVEIDRWAPEETRTIVLARWHAVTVVVDLSAVAADLRGAAFGLTVARAAAAPDAPASALSAAHDTEGNTLLYRISLPSDRYVLRGGCGLFSIPDTPLDLTDEQEDVTLKVAAR